jgi:hypothetical protein
MTSNEGNRLKTGKSIYNSITKQKTEYINFKTAVSNEICQCFQCNDRLELCDIYEFCGFFSHFNKILSGTFSQL